MAWVPAWHEHCGRVTVTASSALLGYLLLSATNPCSVRAAVVGPANGVGAGDRWPLRQPGGDPCRLATGETARTAERTAAAMLFQNISSVLPAITRAHVRTVSAIFAVTARRGCTGTGS